MGEKTRGNYAPCYNLTEEEFNKIFYKEKDGDGSLKSRHKVKGNDSSSKNGGQSKESKPEKKTRN